MNTSDKIFLIILGAIGLGGILVFGIKLMLQPNRASIPSEYNLQNKPNSPQTKIISDTQTKQSRKSVSYKNKVFFPASTTVQNQDGDGCILAIINQDPGSLLIRLSPHSEKDDQGVLYPEIAPGESILIDPRYRIAEIAFHNHRNPNEEFKVILGEGCEL